MKFQDRHNFKIFGIVCIFHKFVIAYIFQTFGFAHTFQICQITTIFRKLRSGLIFNDCNRFLISPNAIGNLSHGAGTFKLRPDSVNFRC